MDEKNQKLQELLSDEAYVKSLLEADNEEAVQKMLADKGVSLSLTEIELLGEVIEAGMDGRISVEDLQKITNMGELSEDELEAAAGGGAVFNFFHDIYTTNLLAVKSLGDKLHAGKITQEHYNEAIQKFTTTKLNSNFYTTAAIVGIAALGAIGYGVYDAVRRRW